MMRSIAVLCGMLLLVLVPANWGFAVPVSPGAPDYTWLFNETSGTTAAPFTGGVNGTLETGATFVPQATPVTNGFNHVVQLDGVSGNVNFGTNPGFDYVNTTFTTSFWLRAPATTDRVMLLAKADAASTFGNNGNSWAYQLELTGTTSQYAAGVITSAGSSRYEAENTATPLDNDVWHHIAAILNTSGAGDVKIYVDGVERTTSLDQNNFGTYLGAPNVALRLGARALGGGTNLPLAGFVDEFGLYNRALTDGEIEWLAGNSLDSFQPVPAPEPGSLLLVSTLLVMGAQRRRRQVR
jgi:hypothetical protein